LTFPFPIPTDRQKETLELHLHAVLILHALICKRDAVYIFRHRRPTVFSDSSPYLFPLFEPLIFALLPRFASFSPGKNTAHAGLSTDTMVPFPTLGLQETFPPVRVPFLLPNCSLGHPLHRRREIFKWAQLSLTSRLCFPPFSACTLLTDVVLQKKMARVSTTRD